MTALSPLNGRSNQKASRQARKLQKTFSGEKFATSSKLPIMVIETVVVAAVAGVMLGWNVHVMRKNGVSLACTTADRVVSAITGSNGGGETLNGWIYSACIWYVAEETTRAAAVSDALDEALSPPAAPHFQTLLSGYVRRDC